MSTKLHLHLFIGLIDDFMCIMTTLLLYKFYDHVVSNEAAIYRAHPVILLKCWQVIWENVYLAKKDKLILPKWNYLSTCSCILSVLLTMTLLWHEFSHKNWYMSSNPLKGRCADPLKFQKGGSSRLWEAPSSLLRQICDRLERTILLIGSSTSHFSVKRVLPDFRWAAYLWHQST